MKIRDVNKLKLASLVILLCVLAAYVAGCNSAEHKKSSELDKQYKELDSELLRVARYDAMKEDRISALKKQLQNAGNRDSKMEIIDRLIGEYESFVSDSAIYYIGQNIQLASEAGNPHKVEQLKLKRVDVLSHAGLFGDAMSEMKKINKALLDSALLEEYYFVNCGLYQYMREYNTESYFNETADSMLNVYNDSLHMIAASHSLNRITYETNVLIGEGNTDRAQEILLDKMKQYGPGSHEYAILASILAYSYKREGDDVNYQKYLVQSAISDIKNSTKENMSFRELSQALFDEGDIEHAKHYLQKSFDDANMFSARMRTAQSARMLPVIDTAYDDRQEQLQRRLKWAFLTAITLAIILAVAALLILKQMRRIRKANVEIKSHNEELSKMSQQLSLTNAELAKANDSLKQSDSIKEEYARLFMQFSSLTISNLESYQQSLHNLAVKGQTKELVKKIDNNNLAEHTLKDFYNKFDEAILNIYPNFIERVNSLLQTDAQIVPKPGSKLNTELRVLALIRIGVTDSEKIAEFLRCSLTTIYTYRSKIRKRALNPDTFENDVKD